MTGVWNQGGQVGDGLLTKCFPGWRLEGGEMVRDLWGCFITTELRMEPGCRALGSFEQSVHLTATLRDKKTTSEHQQWRSGPEKDPEIH